MEKDHEEIPPPGGPPTKEEVRRELEKLHKNVDDFVARLGDADVRTQRLEQQSIPLVRAHTAVLGKLEVALGRLSAMERSVSTFMNKHASAMDQLAKHTYRELGDYGVMLDKLKSDIEPLLRNVPIVASRLSALESGGTREVLRGFRKCIVISCDEPAKLNHVLCERHAS